MELPDRPAVAAEVIPAAALRQLVQCAGSDKDPFVHQHEPAGQAPSGRGNHHQPDRRHNAWVSLNVHCPPDETSCPKGVKVTQEETGALDFRRDGFHGEWNYALMTRPKAKYDAVIS